jgi:peptide deformylase
MSATEAGDLTIVRYGHPMLRRKAEPVGRVTSDIRRLANRMADLMREARGVGLAANQVGVPRQLAVIEIDGKLTPLIDPEIVSSRGEEITDEGCLSLPRLYAHVPRPVHVVVRARNLSGRRVKIEAEGLLARALCHEIDHLNGRLFVDRIVDHDSLYWLVGHSEEGEPLTQSTTLEDALKVFSAATRSHD